MPGERRRVAAFCPLCVSRCGCEAIVEDGRLVAIEPDPSHPTGKALCAKGRASPELVEATDRLLYPMRRTRPKGDPDPGWQRITWDEALDETATAMRRIAAESGPEAVAFAITTPSGTAISDAAPWIDRLINAFGSPNNCNATELCAWHRNYARAFTTGTAIGTPDYERAGCILLWGHNPSTSLLAAATKVADAKARGAKLIVIDPRRIGFAVKADCWLRVRPGTDAAVALAIAGVMIDQGWFDAEFVRNWTNGPFLVRDDDGTMLRSEILAAGGKSGGFVAWDETRGAPVTYDIGKRRCCETPGRLAISGEFVLDTREGPIRCRPAFELFAARCRAMSPEDAAAVSGVEPEIIRESARLLWHHRPVAHYTWTGLEQHTNATQTDRAIAILHALTGSIDVPGGNVHFGQVPVNDVSGVEFRDAQQWQKALGLKERPLGPAADGWITSTDLYRAVLDRQPYQVRGLVGLGANLLLSHADAKRGAEALRSLEFHVQTDLYLTPTAAYADIVLPIASGWEREGLRVGFALDQSACEYVQLRPAVVPPRGEARADIDVVFDLAVRLGLGDHFWNGDVEAALAHHLAPSGLTPDTLRNAPRRTMRLPLETRYRKYQEQGFGTPSGKVEIFSTALQTIGQSPLPEFRPPHLDPTSKFPLVLTSAKTPIYCHSQHRNLARLRRIIPDPVVEINPVTAELHEIEQDEWVSISTPRGSVRARAHLNASLADGVIGGQHGWWQSCPDLGLPGYDPLGSDGANINLVIGDEVLDPVSGAAPHRAYPCQLHKLDENSGWRTAIFDQGGTNASGGQGAGNRQIRSHNCGYAERLLHRDGNFSHIAREHPEANIDMPFLRGTIPNVRRLADAFRAARRPVVYLAHVLKPDYSDAAFPYWRLRMEPGGGNRTHCVEGTWGAQIIDELTPQEGEHLIAKKGFWRFLEHPLDTVLRNMGVTTCVACGVTTCVCVSTTIRGGVEYNYRMIVVGDAVAEVDRTTHEAELRTMARVFADVKTTDEVVGMLDGVSS